MFSGKRLAFLLVCSMVLPLAADSPWLRNPDRQMEAKRQMDEYLTTYLSFDKPSDFDSFMQLSKSVSIDKVEGDRVYAYANEGEFQALQDGPFAFTVEDYPRSTVAAEMSDYSDFSIGQDITKYPTYEGYLQMLKKFEQDAPNLCKTEEIGKSGQGRSILALNINNNTYNVRKPKVFLSCAIHGDEMNGTMILFNYLSKLVKRAETDEGARSLLNNVDLYFAPFCNPDGTYRGGNNSVKGAVRSNGKGVDLNRDFPAPGGSGYAPRAQAETRALINWEKKTGIRYGLDYHDGMSAIVCHWSYTKSRPKDWNWMVEVGKKGYATPVGLQFGQAAVDWYPASGTRMDWQPHFNKCQGFTVEVGNKGTQSSSTLLNLTKRHTPAIDTFLQAVAKYYQGYPAHHSFTYAPVAEVK